MSDERACWLVTWKSCDIFPEVDWLVLVDVSMSDERKGWATAGYWDISWKYKRKTRGIVQCLKQYRGSSDFSGGQSDKGII